MIMVRVVIGDGVLTPAINVFSAVSGLELFMSKHHHQCCIHYYELLSEWFTTSADVEVPVACIILGDIKKKMAAGEDVDALVANGKSHGREWLKGRHGKSAGLASTSSVTADDTADPYLHDLTAKIRREIQAEFDAKLNKNNAMLLKKLGEANPSLNLDISDYCPVLSSEDDENATPLTGGATS